MSERRGTSSIDTAKLGSVEASLSLIFSTRGFRVVPVTSNLWQYVSFKSLIVASAVFRGDIGYGYIDSGVTGIK